MQTSYKFSSTAVVSVLFTLIVCFPSPADSQRAPFSEGQSETPPAEAVSNGNALTGQDPAEVLSAIMAEFRKSMKRTRLLLLREVTWPLRAICRLQDDTYIAVLYVDGCPRFYLIAPESHGPSPATSNQKPYRVVADAVVVEEGLQSVCLDPVILDADRDGSPEVLIQLVRMAVDCGYASFVLFSRSGGSWKVYGSPKIGNDGELGQVVRFGGKEHLLETLESGMWRLIDRPDGTKSFLAWMTWTGVGYGGGPHPTELQMFRFTPTGFVRDPTWNGGKSFVWTGGNTFALGAPIYSADAEMQNKWVEKGYAGTLTSADSLQWSTVVNP